MPEDNKDAAKPAVPPMPDRNPALIGLNNGKVVIKVVPVGGGGGVGAPDAPPRRHEGEGRDR